MTRRIVLQAARTILRGPQIQPIRTPLLTTSRGISSSSSRREEDRDRYKHASTQSDTTQDHEGQHSRTDRGIKIGYDDAESMTDVPIQGRGGVHLKRTLPLFSLEDKTAVVTGGARGLGLVMGQALVQSGADLAIVDLNKDEGERQANEIINTFKQDNDGAEEQDQKSFPGRNKSEFYRQPKVTAHHADVSNPDSVDACLKEILQAHGKVDCLITSAGFTENFSAESYPYDRIKKLWGVNVDGTYLFATGVAKHLMERKAPGSICMVGSMSGAIVNVPQPQAPYNAAKAAVRHMAASFAVEWAQYNIRVNCLSPGYMLTALTRKILDDNPELEKKWTSLIPVGKMGVPENLTGPACFLLSDASSYMTGAELRVDGGYTCT